MSFLHVEAVKTTDHTFRMGANEVTCNASSVKSDSCVRVKNTL